MQKTWIVLGLIAAGCGAKQAPEPAKPQVAIEISSGGLTPFPDGEVTKASLAAAFDGYEVVTKDNLHFAIRNGGDTVVHVEKVGDTIRAKVTGALVAGPAGVRVGTLWPQFSQLQEVQCRRGASPWSEMAFCTAETVPNLVFAFDIKGIVTPDCIEACVINDLSVMGATTVRYIDWQP